MPKMLALVWNDLRPVCSRQDKTREKGEVPDTFCCPVAHSFFTCLLPVSHLLHGMTKQMPHKGVVGERKLSVHVT